MTKDNIEDKATRYFPSDAPLDRKEFVKAVVIRMREAYNVKTYAELSEIAHIDKGSIANSISGGRIPFKHVANCHADTGYSYDYLLLGEKPNVMIDTDVSQKIKQMISGKLIDSLEWDLMSSGEGIDILSDRIAKAAFEIMECKVFENPASSKKTG
ncbi:helix-turn-helix domain containing protein [Pseudoalteromonas sp. C2R02]|uniref:helix-turn-helix domain-containing protein n=1 Tax=Pseudoalteromonas sp. C2R02 TaxID=2841565 RepID=UPI001C0A1E42|nr:helix-turn-helix domain-containing protein [Pseudoalteromonas sp. C2R02]MBU2968749.1 helix-turn-helix domain containing protein [Pseudoalteromonas sp. C2R02]